MLLPCPTAGQQSGGALRHLRPHHGHPGAQNEDSRESHHMLLLLFLFLLHAKQQTNKKTRKTTIYSTNILSTSQVLVTTLDTTEYIVMTVVPSIEHLDNHFHAHYLTSPHSIPKGQAVLPPFYREGNWGVERLTLPYRSLPRRSQNSDLTLP